MTSHLVVVRKGGHGAATLPLRNFGQHNRSGEGSRESSGRTRIRLDRWLSGLEVSESSTSLRGLQSHYWNCPSKPEE
jgi:hypothetical protein